MAVPVFDRDPLTDRWVIHAPARSERLEGDAGGGDTGCPFCPGNEAATPAASLSIADEQGRWLVRVFPNLYPAVRPDRTEDPADGAPRSGNAAHGIHEVVVFDRDHGATFADLDDVAATRALRVFLQRTDDHHGAGLPYVQPFINQGRAAGATVEHPHAQILGLAVVPPAFASEERTLATRPCPLCELLRDPSHLVVDHAGLGVTCPPWAAGPYEIVIAPGGHVPSRGCDPDELGPLLRDTLRALREAAGEVAYNVVFHVSAHHWHVHVHPRTTVAAGFELASGILINPSSPDQDRQQLREAWTD